MLMWSWNRAATHTYHAPDLGVSVLDPASSNPSTAHSQCYTPRLTFTLGCSALWGDLIEVSREEYLAPG